MFVYLNKYAGGGRALAKWHQISSELSMKFPDEKIKVFTESRDLNAEITRQYYKDERFFVAAGGDGTVNILLNEIWKLHRDMRDNVILGAIGLGSSNDFHKPFSRDSYLDDGIPCKLNYKNAVRHNIGRITYIDEDHEEHDRCFLINCSAGIVAYANYLFNDKDRVIRLLKTKSTNIAIWYAGLKSLIKYKNAGCILKIESNECETSLSNLGVLIKPNFSGDFCYDIEVNPQSDYFGIALCENMKPLTRMRTINCLSKGKFRELPDTRVWQGRRIAIKSSSLIPLEFDGEVVMARDIKIELIRGGLKVCV